MGNVYYRSVNGDTETEAYADPQNRVNTDLQDDLARIQELQGFSDELRSKLFQGAPGFEIAAGQFQTLEDLDEALEKEAFRIQDILDLSSYTKAPPVGFNVCTDDLYLPEALEAPLPDDNGTDVVANAIDAVGAGDPDPNDPLSSTFWQSEVSGLRVLTVRLRSYPKKVLGVRFRTNNGDARAQLQGVTIKAAKALGNLDQNIVAQAVDFDDQNSWFEVAFTKSAVRYIQVEAATSNHTTPDVLRIRSMQVRVGVTNHEK